MTGLLNSYVPVIVGVALILGLVVLGIWLLRLFGRLRLRVRAGRPSTSMPQSLTTQEIRRLRNGH